MVVISLLTFTVARLAVLGPREAFGSRAPGKIAAPIDDRSVTVPVARVAESEVGDRAVPGPVRLDAAPSEVSENLGARDALRRGA